MSAKKVLMFGWEYPPHHSGGLGVACKGMAHALIDNDVHVCFVLPRKLNIEEHKVTLKFAESVPSKNTSPLIKANSEYLEILTRELHNPYITSVEYEKKLKHFIASGGMIVPRTLLEQVDHYARMVKHFSKEELKEYDLIHAHDWLCYPAGIAAKEISGKPLVVHVHATEFDRCGGKNVNQAVYNREREGMHKADRIIAVSEFTKNTIVSNYGIDPNKVTVVHNGNSPLVKNQSIKYSYLHELRKHNKKIVLYAGRITIQKGVDYFIRAAKKVLDYEPDVYFIVAGTGDMENQIITLANDLGIGNKFIFTGFYTGEEFSEFLSVSDVFVMPSVSEPFGVTPLESMSSGTPVIVSKQSGVSEVITHALKVDFWDIDQMSNQILAVLRHSPLRQTLQTEGLNQVNGLTWDKAAKKMKHLYQNIS